MYCCTNCYGIDSANTHGPAYKQTYSHTYTHKYAYIYTTVIGGIKVESL